jgi:hypothetical protein
MFFYLFVALHGVALAAREAANSVLAALALVLVYGTGLIGAYQVLVSTVLVATDGRSGLGQLRAMLTGHATQPDATRASAPAESPVPPAAVAESPGEDVAEDEDLGGVNELQNMRKQQQRSARDMKEATDRMLE